MNPILLSETDHNGRTQICLLHMDAMAKRLGVSLQRAYEPVKGFCRLCVSAVKCE